MANNSSPDAPLSAPAKVAQDSLVAPAATGAAQDTVQIVRDDSGLSSSVANNTDPLDLGRHRRENVSKQQIKLDHPQGKNKKQIRKYYTRQNKLIDQFLGADDEEQNKIEEDIRYKPKIKFAVTASFVVNFFLFVIQMYAAIATGSLSLFATAADAFMDLVSSFVMLITSRLAARPSVYKFPVGRTRIETLGIILFCALMTTVAVQLLIESARRLGGGPSESEPLKIVPLVFVGIAIFAKASLMVYCFAYRRFPSVHIFFVDHRNDIVVNIFGLIMSIVGDRFVWYLDPIGAILIALLILFSWAANAFEQVWLLVGKSAPRHFISKLIYMAMTHDDRVVKVDTCRAYHAGQRYYVEIDIVMDEELPLRITHDIAQELQRKLEGLSDVERAFVHVDYEHDHDPHEEHKPLYDKMSTMKKSKRNIRDILLFRKPAIQQGLAEAGQNSN
ncbi:cation efflux family-domain-containing protein [Lasiosphaeria hispida]|uniref:Cation efflux family-domain-containing protein n=1 Tax=Lasiosphaeria hispida TaxID=260671 RepID=A0AAJ0MCT3_9PEZI|nr:cation efflux family-domain-containing protein [Lasiosphaeria hispida]